ncbi:MAG: class I SAM-dependent RNA methyltransferase [Desulfobacteraceae bacterium]|nr:class I SAM-dependent RNA methyltransferase [Desulfobacteraceae bacterium]
MPQPLPHHITIEKIVAGGYGLGRLPDGMVVLVPFTLPGERVRIAPRQRHKTYLEAEAVEIIAPAAERTEPPCPHYGRCGGCHLQHAAYPLQLRLKADVLREQLAAAAVPGWEAAWQEPLAAPAPFGYRQRLRLQIDSGRRVGFHRPRSHQVEPVGRCLLARPEIEDFRARLQGRPSWPLLLAQATSLEIAVSPDEGKIIVLLGYRRRPRPRDFQLAETLAADLPALAGFLFTGDGFAPTGPRGLAASDPTVLLGFTLPESVTGSRPLTLTVEPGGFSQVNPAQNEGLVRTLLAWAAVRPGERVLDLFCGMGNFSLPLALAAGEVTGCDLQGAAIRGARRNAGLAGLAGCRFSKRSAREGAAALLAAGERFDFLLLDPPRQGCADLVDLLPGFGAGRLAYISCDPATLARDLALLAVRGYRLRRVRAVDMFPQTHHLETITLLESEE